MRLCGWILGWLALAGMGVGNCLGQAVAGMGTGSEATPATVEAALHAMSDRAAVVFVGTVTAVRRVGADPASAAAGVVEIDFPVEKAVRGCGAGGTYTLREWAGMWAGVDERFRVGQRMLMMLHAPSASGLSSPVGGAEGAIPVRGGGGTVGEADTTTGTQDAVVDLRWVGAKLGRPVVYRKEAPRGPMGNSPVRGGGLQPEKEGAAGADVVRVSPRLAAGELAAGAVPLVGAEMAAARAVSETAAQSSVPAQEAAVSTVMSMMASWKGSNDAQTR